MSLTQSLDLCSQSLRYSHPKVYTEPLTALPDPSARGGVQNNSGRFHDQEIFQVTQQSPVSLSLKKQGLGCSGVSGVVGIFSPHSSWVQVYAGSHSPSRNTGTYKGGHQGKTLGGGRLCKIPSRIWASQSLTSDTAGLVRWELTDRASRMMELGYTPWGP